MSGQLAPAELDAAIADQFEIVADAREVWLDLLAQHRSETAAYGDSWPGACHDIARAQAARQHAEHRLWDLLTERDTRFPFHGPIYTPTDSEEPF